MKFDAVIKRGKVVSGLSSFMADVGITNGKISAIAEDIGQGEADEIYDASGCYVTPGFIDAHTHMSLPVADTVSSDDFFTGGRAGLYGGVTTIIDFTTPAPGQRLPEAIEERRKEAEVAPIDYSFHGTIYGFDPINREDLEESMNLGVTSFKFFTAYSESDRRTPDGELLEAFSLIEELGGKSMVHCENDEIITHERERLRQAGKTSIENHPDSRPVVSELLAVDKIINLSRSKGGRPHIAHMTAGGSVELLRNGKKTVPGLTGETCPQYLLLDRSTYEDEEGYLFSATPPFREAEDRTSLWQGLKDGVIDMVSTDHCPFTIDQKAHFENDFTKIPQGLPGIETLGPLLLTESVDKNRISIERAVSLISENPARIFGLYPQKGSLIVGTDADLAVIDPKRKKELSPEELHMRTDFNPYTGRTARWWPRLVLLRGQPVIKGGEFSGRKSGGSWIGRARQTNYQGGP